MEKLEKLLRAKEMTIQLVACSDYPYFKDNCKIIGIDLNKQQMLHAYPEVILQINFTRNLERTGNTTIFLDLLDL